MLTRRENHPPLRRCPARRIGLLATAFAFTLCGAAEAASTSPGPGAPDPSFGSAGVTLTPIATSAGANGVAVQEDGGIVVAGVSEAETGSGFAITRYLSDGSLDREFGAAGVVEVSVGDDGMANNVLIQPDGRILAVGTAIVAGEPRYAAVRLNTDGSLDKSFGGDGVVVERVHYAGMAIGAVVTPDGGIVLAGTAKVTNNPLLSKPERLVMATLKLNADGSVDMGYGEQGIGVLPHPGAAYSVVLQPDGKVVIAGEALISLVRSFAAGRLTADGEPDQSFGDAGMAAVPVLTTGAAMGLVLNPDGTIVLAGNAWGTKLATAAVKLTPGGALDESFGVLGVSVLPVGTVVNGMALEPDGQIVIGETQMTAVRLDPNGALDAGFGAGGIVKLATAGDGGAINNVAIQPDGGIVLAGAVIVAGKMQFAVARVLGDTPAPEEPPAEEPPAEEPPAEEPPAEEPPAEGAPAEEPPAEGAPTEEAAPAAPTPASPGASPAAPPDTTITAGPRGRTRDRTPRFDFGAPSGATFECRVDSRRFRPCKAPHTLRRLSYGRHRFEVRAIVAGVAYPYPASRRFRVVRPGQ